MEHRIALERLFKMKIENIVINDLRIKTDYNHTIWGVGEPLHHVSIGTNYFGTYTTYGLFEGMTRWMKK